MYLEPSSNRPKLRIGVMLNSLTVTAWQAKILNELVNAPYLQVALVITNQAPGTAPRRSWLNLKQKWHSLLYSLYCRVDRKLHQAEERNAFEETDVRSLMSGIDVLEVMPIQKKYVDRFEESDIERIKGAQLDVILRFGFRVIKGEILKCARYGVWSYHHDDSREYRGGPPLFWEIYERNPVSGTILQILDESLDGGRILYRSHGATNFTSLFRNQNSIYWKTSDFVIRRLRQLYAEGWESITQLDTYNEVNSYNKPIYRTPRNRQMLCFLAKRALLYVSNGMQSLGHNQWFLGIETRETEDKEKWRWDIICPPRDHFYADPFLFSRGDRNFVFFEDYSFRTQRGTISCMEIDQHGFHSKPVSVLEQDHHFSYPFVFEWDGDVFMIPETCGNRTVEAYRAVQFPHQWEKHKVLLSNVAAVDPTLLQHAGKFWLFVNMAATPGAPINDELFAFHSDSPFGPWQPHRQNPIVSDVCRARPAGRIFEQDGQLIRPSQDCSLRYGHKIKLNRIDVLTETEYKESEIGEIDPTWIQGNIATHCVAFDQNVRVMDGCRRIGIARLWPGLFSVIGRARRSHFVLRVPLSVRRSTGDL
ncbi:MAG TPA: hypothetical protein VEU11_18590 [Terriglobales bacterium]|nr:hypothetical protein [Terriglobales bacterium]